MERHLRNLRTSGKYARSSQLPDDQLNHIAPTRPMSTITRQRTLVHHTCAGWFLAHRYLFWPQVNLYKEILNPLPNPNPTNPPGANVGRGDCLGYFSLLQGDDSDSYDLTVLSLKHTLQHP